MLGLSNNNIFKHEKELETFDHNDTCISSSL